MSHDPQVSVVIPAFNSDQTIGHAISSALNQTVQNIEIIVCDDASSDCTPELVQSIDDARLTLLRNNQNLGPGPSRDRAIQLARGRWIAMLDADDAWQPKRLERLLPLATANPGNLVFDDLMMCHDQEGKLIPWKERYGRNSFNDCSNVSDYIRAPRLLIKPLIPNELIFNDLTLHSDRRFGEDAEFFIKLGLKGARFNYHPEPLYLYRMQPGSLTANVRDPSLMRRCMEDCLQLNGVTEEVRDALLDKINALRINEELHSFAGCVRKGDLTGALRTLKRCPALWKVLPKRAVTHLAYQADRIRHRASKWQ